MGRRKNEPSVCVESGCTSAAVVRGWCRKHYNAQWWQQRKARENRQSDRRRREGVRLCSEPACVGPVEGRGLCSRHYQQWLRREGRKGLIRSTDAHSQYIDWVTT